MIDRDTYWTAASEPDVEWLDKTFGDSLPSLLANGLNNFNVHYLANTFHTRIVLDCILDSCLIVLNNHGDVIYHPDISVFSLVSGDPLQHLLTTFLARVQGKGRAILLDVLLTQHPETKIWSAEKN